MVDFSLWQMNPYRTYGGGNGNKRCMMHDGQPYMVKIFNPNDTLTHSGGAISEHIACTISNLIGIEAQETILGYYKVDRMCCRAVACKDFCGLNDKLQEFSSVKNWVIDSSKHGKGKELLGILIAIDSQALVPAEELKQRFWDVFILDALVGNFDRHPGNFGIIVNEAAQTSRLAPVYDCGSSLFAGAVDDEVLMRRILSDQNEQLARVYEYPLSAMRDTDGRKINYFDFLSEGRDEDCVKALLRITPRINLEEIIGFIRSIDGISELMQEFYCKILSVRKEKILDFCYEKFANQRENEQESVVGQQKSEMLERERVILEEETWGWFGAKLRYAELFRREARNIPDEERQHLFNTDIDVRIATKLFQEGYSKQAIADALRGASPKALGGQAYLDKIMVKARDIAVQKGIKKTHSR